MATEAHADPSRPSLREVARATTRERILTATAELVQEEGTADVPMAAVAVRAGVGERTVYRYFASKLDLYQALFDWMTQRAAEVAPSGVDSVDDLIERAASFFSAYEQHPELIRALAAGSIGTSRAERAEARRAAVTEAMHAEVAGLSEPRRTQLLAAVHLLTSSDAYLHANDFWELDADAVADMVRWAVRTLVAGADRDAGGRA